MEAVVRLARSNLVVSRSSVLWRGAVAGGLSDDHMTPSAARGCRKTRSVTFRGLSALVSEAPCGVARAGLFFSEDGFSEEVEIDPGTFGEVAGEGFFLAGEDDALAIPANLRGDGGHHD